MPKIAPAAKSVLLHSLYSCLIALLAPFSFTGPLLSSTFSLHSSAAFAASSAALTAACSFLTRPSSSSGSSKRPGGKSSPPLSASYHFSGGFVMAFDHNCTCCHVLYTCECCPIQMMDMRRACQCDKYKLKKRSSQPPKPSPKRYLVSFGLKCTTGVHNATHLTTMLQRAFCSNAHVMTNAFVECSPQRVCCRHRLHHLM